ncbi:MAG: LysM peptidoglycan-binding domain-containing protein [Chloroflexota bacterium]|nr:LysM peptidoglycan-binding domain-containing protein [Chloroflexota bacterium]MDE2910117.1 LysM peptidoglycan-binding domain-containing protein [Chloroflexota bacterium]
MFKRPRRLQLIASLVALSLLLAACFRDTSEVIEQQPVARQLASPTVVEVAMPTVMVPTEMPATPTEEPQPTEEEPQPTETEADQFALTATALIARQTQPAAGEQPASDVAIQATAAPPARATIPPGADCVHEIRVGDTLFQVSLAYGVTVNDIARASGIDNPDRIAVGQHVTIPKCGTTGFIPPPTSVPTPTPVPQLIAPTSEGAALDLAAADTRDTLIEQAQTSLLDNALTDAETELRIQTAVLPTASNTYTVQQNDTLFGIAILLGTSVEVLAALNDITDVDSLDAGQVLQTP